MARRTKKEVEKPCACGHYQNQHESWLDPDEACPCTVGRRYSNTYKRVNGEYKKLGCECFDWEPMPNLEFCRWLEEKREN